ncbi:sugar phosphate isomerase/epimerase family protein [Neobacillus dielmonensis]|uniref:sugar phosphate isomerase/epimerase family protein n=1 Tax=Neobacillus dielmonensis TaxID=1347369 RepID=UPI0005A9AE25|nr:sugar phosphate isomerase/epimerase family protein [Neobacillus dielmonensis]
MKTSVSMYSLHKYVAAGKMSILEFIDYAASIGVDGVELLDIYWNDEEMEIPQVLSRVKEKNLQVSAYDITNNFVKESQEERDQETARVRKSVDIAKKLDTKVVRIFSGDVHQGISFEQGKQWIIEGLKESAKYAEEKGVLLGIENHGYFAGRSAQVAELIEAVGSPNVRSTLDTGNFLLVDENPKDAVTALKHDAVHVHFKDFIQVDSTYEEHAFQSLAGKRYAGTAAGEGNVDLHHVITELKSADYQGWLSVEFEGAGDAKQGTEKSVANLKTILLAAR